MMQLIRDKAQGIVAWVIVAMIGIVFTLWGVNGYFSKDASSVVAKFNGDTITSQQVEEHYTRWLNFSSKQKGFDITKINPIEIKQQIARGLAERLALIRMLQRSGYDVSNNMLLDSIRNNPDMQENGKFSIERYKRILSYYNLDEATFEQMQRDDLLLNQVQNAVLASSFSLDSELSRVIDLQNQKRSFSYIVLPLTRYLNNIAVSDAQLEEYYQKHSTQYVSPEKVKLEYIELSIEDLLRQVNIKEADLRAYYDNNMQFFSEPETLRVRHIMVAKDAKEKIEAIAKKLSSGADFATIAKQESSDKATASAGGDLGWVNKNDGFPDEVYDLKKVKDYTPIVASEHGWHIFQLVDRKGGSVQSFASVRSSILARLQREEAERLFAERGEELSALAQQDPKSLQAAADKLQLPVKTSGFFTHTGGTGIAAASNIVNAAFSEPVLQQGRNSELLRLNDDTYLVLRVADKQPQRQLALSEVKSEVRKELQKTLAQKKAQEETEKLLADFKNGVNTKQAWKTLSNVGRDSKQVDPYILQMAFSMPHPHAPQNASYNSVMLPNGDRAILALKQVSKGTLEKNTDQSLRENIAKQIAILNGNLQFLAMQADLVAKAKIKYIGAQL